MSILASRRSIVDPTSPVGGVAWQRLAAGLALLAAGTCGAPAAASVATSTVAVSSTVNSFCSLSASTMAFGVYSGVAINSTAALTVTCTNTTAYQIGADGGLNSQYIGVIAKYMLGPSNSKLRYHLYTDAARSIEWGTTAGSDEVAGTGTGSPQNIPVYGTVGAGSYSSLAGAYTDTVTFTITF